MHFAVPEVKDLQESSGANYQVKISYFLDNYQVKISCFLDNILQCIKIKLFKIQSSTLFSFFNKKKNCNFILKTFMVKKCQLGFKGIEGGITLLFTA